MSFDKTVIYLSDNENDFPNKATALPVILREEDSIAETSPFRGRKRRFNKEILKICLQSSGIKDCDAYLFAERVFSNIIALAEAFSSSLASSIPFSSPSSLLSSWKIITSKRFLMELLRKELELKNYVKPKFDDKLELSFLLIENKVNIIILLGGTSGTGKSSVASLLATKLGIPTVLSTDSIRHIMRNFVEKEDFPVLFASTYEAGKKLVGKDFDSLTDKKKITKGYLMQSALVLEKLESLIDTFQTRKESLLIEGVHLTPDFMRKINKKYPSCLSFLIYISNESKHKERFAVRSKYMTLDERFNKYVENFNSIRVIQKFLLKKANEYLIPRVDNTNIDKSMGLVLKTIMRYLRKIEIKKKGLGPEGNPMMLLYEEFNKVNGNVWSSQAVKNYVMAKVTRSELLERKRENLRDNNYTQIEGFHDPIKEKKEDEEEGVKRPDEGNKEEIGEHRQEEEGKREEEVGRRDEGRRKEDVGGREESNGRKEGTGREEDEERRREGLGRKEEIGKREEEECIRKSVSLEPNEEIYSDIPLHVLDKSKTGQNSSQLGSPSSAMLTKKIQIKDIKEMLNQNNRISLDKNLTPVCFMKVKNLISELNHQKRKAKHFRFEFIRTSDRYLIIKRTNSLKDLSQRKEEKREEAGTREDEEGKNQEIIKVERDKERGRVREEEEEERKKEEGGRRKDEVGSRRSSGGEKRMHHLSKDDTTKDEFYGVTSGTDEEENEKIDEIKSSSIGESMNNFHGGTTAFNEGSEMMELSDHDSFRIDEEIEDNSGGGEDSIEGGSEGESVSSEESKKDEEEEKEKDQST